MDSRHGAAPRGGISPTLSELLLRCSAVGLDVRAAALPEGWLGAYDHRHRRVLLAHGLTPVEQRCVLAHELGHAVLAHDGPCPVQERAAERFAARLLIDPLVLREACRWARNDVELAEELDVTVDVIESYRELIGSVRSAA